jgi:hypothetical protein
MPCFLAIRSPKNLLIWNVWDIHSFVKVQMVAGAKFALICLRIHHPKIDLQEVAKGVLLKSSKKKINLDLHIEAVSGPAEKMIDKLLEVDSDFFKNFRYDESTQQNACLQRKYRQMGVNNLM